MMNGAFSEECRTTSYTPAGRRPTRLQNEARSATEHVHAGDQLTGCDEFEETERRLWNVGRRPTRLPGRGQIRNRTRSRGVIN